MKRGVSKKKIIKVVLVGTAGSGKSTSLETVMDEKPPAEEDRESTPLLKRPVQTEVLYIHNKVNWVKKTPQQKRQYVACLLRACAQQRPLNLINQLIVHVCALDVGLSETRHKLHTLIATYTHIPTYIHVRASNP